METALEVLKEFCRADFVERDAQKAAGFLTENIAWFGTSEGEDVHNREEALQYIMDEIAKNPCPYRVQYTYEHQTATSETSSAALLKIKLSTQNATMLCRVTASAMLEDGRTKLATLHMSVSNSLQRDSEYFPISFSEEREREMWEQLLNETVAGGMMGGYIETDFPFYFINHRMLEILGYAGEQEFVEDIGGKVINCMHPDDRAAVDSEVERQLLQSEEYVVEYRMRKKDGSYIWTHDVGRKITAEDGRDAIISVCYDITEQKLAQQELAMSESKLAAVVQYADIQVWEYDIEKSLCYVTELSQGRRRITRILENYPEYLFEKGYVHPDDQERCRKMHSALREGAKEYEEQFRIRYEDEAEFRWILCKYICLPGDNGKLGRAIGMAQSMEQYKELEEQFYVSSSQAGIALWSLEFHTNTIHWNNIPYGFPENMGQYQDMPQEILLSCGLICPEDTPYVLEKHQELYEGRTSVSFACRILQNDGVYRWFRVFYTLIMGRSGKPIRAIGTAININEQREAEKKYNELVDSYQKFGGSDTILVGNCNITQNKMLGITDSTDSGLLERFGQERETFFTRCSELLVEEAKREEFLRLFLNQPLKEAFLNGQKFFKLEGYLRLPSAKEPIYAEITVNVARSPETQDLIGFLRVRDVSGQRLAQIKLEDTKRLVSRVIERDYDFIIGVNTLEDTFEVISFGRDEAANLPALKSYLSFSGAYIERYVAEEERGLVREKLSADYIKRELKVSSAFYFTYHVLENGKVFTKKGSVFNIDLEAGQIAITCEDITDALLQEQKQNELLASALDKAKKADAAKSDFLSRMSHEIRTPMNAILGLTQLAQMSEDISPDVADKLGKINASSKFLLSLVNDILDMSKIESQKMRIETSPFRLDTLLNELTDLFEPQAAQKGIEYTCGCVSEDFTFVGDELRIKQVLVNLLSNAIKFTDEGGKVHLQITEQARTDAEAALLFSVEDTGIGIRECDAQKIFRVFEQAARDSSHRQNGTGLGLSISYNLAELMGGRLEMKSTYGKGSVFYFTVTLPISSQVLEPDKAVVSAGLLKGRTFLLAEDNDLNAEIAMEILSSQHAHVDWVSDGKLAVEAFSQHPAGYYDAVLMDILMPEMNGLEAAKAIRRYPRQDAARIPIIAMTANAFQEDFDKAAAAGMNGFIPKPFEIKQLYQVLNSCLQNPN